MVAPYPLINIEGFKNGVYDGIKIIAKFFNEFQPIFAGAPDERGLTDQLLLAIVKKSGKIMLLPQHFRHHSVFGEVEDNVKKNTSSQLVDRQSAWCTPIGGGE
ncbi:hypothetical protein C8J57DRAFT_1239471 [Mycena rebaudengoi]|nr:hypothetical protein C8J57DRAFT_1239471 [Mycena rebaudengoi]